MKRISARRCLAVMLLVPALITSVILSGCTGFVESDTVDGLEIYYGDGRNYCFVGSYTYDGETTDIVIPDEYKGKPVTRLGGYLGSGLPVEFRIDIRSLCNCSDGESYIYNNYFPDGGSPVIPDGTTMYTIDLSSSDLVVDIHREIIPFTVHIGKNIAGASGRFFSPNVYHVNADGSVTVYNVEYRFECSPENSVYYSEDGVLYRKDTGKALTTDYGDMHDKAWFYVSKITSPGDIVISPSDAAVSPGDTQE